jgi:hypothetical protein
MRFDHTMPANKQLQRTVTRRRGDGASAPFHYALAPRWTAQRAAAELRRYAAMFKAGFSFTQSGEGGLLTAWSSRA